jgi:hypothetical protein
MTATSRWVRFPVAGATYISSASVGNRGFCRGSDTIGDTFTIPGSSANQIQVNVDAAGWNTITLSSGTNLEARFVAKDIQRKVQALSTDDKYKYFTCEFSNLCSADGLSHFVMRSGSTGTGSSVDVTNGSSDALATLGLTTHASVAGNVKHTDYTRTLATGNSGYAGVVTTSGTYGGLLDEEYHVVVNDVVMLSSVAGTHNFAGTHVATSDFNNDTAASYTVTIDTTGGHEVMNAGTGEVPTFTVVDSGGLGDSVATAQELLYSDNWYYIGTQGVRMKFSDAQFTDGDTFTVSVAVAAGGAGAIGASTFVYTSDRGDNAVAGITTSSTPVNLGTKGVTIAWSSGNLAAKDEWRVMCRAPTPEAYGVTSMSYGNVTVTTNSPVKVHQFELMSGARVLSNCKFSLQSHGTFSHHSGGDNDTEFHYGTVGVCYRGDGATAGTGVEWKASIAATDIAANKTGGNTGAPVNLYASKDNLSVISDADSAETVGNYGLTSDAIFTAIQLGANETGANSGIVYRMYFDYS